MTISASDISQLTGLNKNFIAHLKRISHVNLQSKKDGFGGRPLSEMDEKDFDWILIMSGMYNSLKSETEQVKGTVSNFLNALAELQETCED